MALTCPNCGNVDRNFLVKTLQSRTSSGWTTPGWKCERGGGRPAVIEVLC